jgi:hypothetical protein
MSGDRRVSDEDLAEIRQLAAAGVTRVQMAARFGITPQHVGRLVRGEQRGDVAAGDDAPELGPVCEAVERYLAGLTLDSRANVLAAAVRAVAAKLDAAAASSAASAAAAVPRLYEALEQALGELRMAAPREPDAIDRIAARHAARRAGLAAQWAAQQNGDAS